MREERTIHLVEIPIGGKDGFVWNRLHEEREEICESLLKEATYVERQILQTRLRKIDPAVALCRDCRRGQPGAAALKEDDESNMDGVMLESLKPFDTILLRTYNTDYRILLLDPQTGRTLVEGGEYLVEPKEALVRGSAIPGSEFKSGCICVGSRLEIWVDERVLLTSTIKSVHVKHNSAAESVEDISAALH
jgi:hypothetical protein